MKGIGTDEATLIKVLGARNPAERLLIRAEFEKQFGRDLIKDIKSETSGNFKNLLVNLVIKPNEVRADYLYDAMAGAGTKDAVLIDVITQTNNKDMAETKQIYQTKYAGKKTKKKGYSGAPTALENDVKDDCSGNFENILLALLAANRDESATVNDALASDDAKLLYQKGEGKFGTDEATFTRIMTSRSVPHLQAVDRHYRNLYKRSLGEAIAKETSGDYKDALVACTKTLEVYMAERAHEAIAGLGTKDDLLVYIFAVHDKPTLQKISQAYLTIYKKSLETHIRGDTSGDYQKLLLALLA